VDTEARISFIGEDRGLKKVLEATADATRKIYTTTQDTVGQLGKYQDKLGSVEKALEATTRATNSAVTGIGNFTEGMSSSYKGLIDGSEQTIKVADALDSRFVSFAARQAGLGKQFQIFNSILQPTAGFMQDVADQTDTASKAATILDAAADPLIGSLKSVTGISESFAKQLVNMGVVGGAAANQLLGLSKTLNGISRAVGLADTAGDVLLLGNSIKQFGEDNGEAFVGATKALAPMAAKMLGVRDATTAATAAANIFKEHNDQIVRTLAQVVLKAGDVATGLMFFTSVAKAVIEVQYAMANLNETFDAFQAMGIDSTYAKAGMQLGLMGEGLIFNTEAAREFATVAIGAFAKLQDSLAYVNTLSSGQAVGIEKMGQAMTDLVNGPLKNSITSNEAAASLYNTMSAGITDMGDATKFMSAGLKLASGSGADASQTMELLAKITSTYGLANRDAALTAAKLNGVVEQGIVTFPQLTGGLSRVATVAKASGVSFDEFLGSVSALTMTMSADDSMTGLASLLQSIAGQGDGAQKAIAELGLKFDTNSIKSKGLSESLKELYKATGGSTSKLKEIIPDALAFQTALTLMTSAADNTGKFTKNIAKTTTDTLDSMFDNRQQSLIKQTTALMNGFGEVVIDFGQKLAPIIEPGIKFLQGALNILQNLPDPLKALVASMVVGGIAMNNATRAGGFFVNMLLEMAKTAVIARLAKLAFTGQIFQEIAAVKHLATVQKDYVGAFLQAIGIQQQGAQSTKKVVAAQEAQAKAQEMLNRVMGTGKVKLDEGLKAYESAYAKIEGYRRQLAEAAKSGVSTTGVLPSQKDLDAAEKQVQKAFAAAQEVKKTFAAVQSAVNAGGDAVKSGFTTMMSNAGSAVSAKSAVVEGAFGKMFSGVKEQFSGKQGDLKGIFSSLSDGLSANLPQAKNKVTEAMQGMLGALDNLSPQFQKRREALTEKVGGIMDKIGEMKDPDQRKKATDILGQILGGTDLDSGIAKQKAALTNAIDNLWESVSTVSKEGIDKVRVETEKIQSLLTGVIPADLTAGVSEKFDRLNQLVKEGLAGVGDPELVARSKAEIEKLSTSINESLAGAIDPETKARLAANLESIQATFADTVSVVSTKASGLAGDVKASFAHLGESAAQALGSGVESIRVKADQFKESLMGMVPPEAVAEISAKFEKIDQSVRQGLAGIGDPELVARSKAEIDKLSASINQSLADVADPETKSRLAANLESIQAAFSDTVSVVSTKAGEFANDVKAKFDGLGEKASEALSSLISGDDVERVKANLQKLTGELQSGLSGAGDGTAIGQKISAQLDGLTAKLRESASAFKIFSGQVGNDLKADLLPRVEGSVAELRNSFDQLVPPDLRAKISGELEQVAAAAASSVEAIGKGVPATIEEMQVKLQEAIARSNVAIADIANDETRAKALGGLNQITANIEKEMAAATGKLGEMKAKLQASASQSAQAVSSSITAQPGKVSFDEGMASSATKVQSVLDRVWGKIKATNEVGEQSVREFLKELNDDLKGMISDEALAEISAKSERINQVLDKQALDPAGLERQRAEIQAVVASISQSLEGIADDETRARVSDNLEQLTSDIDEGFVSAKQESTQFVGDVKSILSKLQNEAPNIFAGLSNPEDMDAAKARLAQFSDAVQKNADRMGNAFVSDSVRKNLVELTQQFDSSAQNLTVFREKFVGEFQQQLLPRVDGAIADLKVSMGDLVPKDVQATIRGEMNGIVQSVTQGFDALKAGSDTQAQAASDAIKASVIRSNLAIASIADDETRAKMSQGLEEIVRTISTEMETAHQKIKSETVAMSGDIQKFSVGVGDAISKELPKSSEKVKSGFNSLLSSAMASFGLDPGMLQDLKDVASGLQEEMGDALAVGTKKASVAQNTLAQSTSGLIAGLTGAKDKVMENVNAGGLLERTNNALTKSRTLDLSSLKEHVVEMAKSVNSTIARSAAEAKAMERTTISQAVERTKNAVTAAGTVIQERATVVAVASGKAISGLANSTRLLATQGLPAAIKGIATQTSALVTNTGAAAANALQGAKNIKNLSLWGNLQTLVSAGFMNSTKALYANIVASNLNNAATAKTGFFASAAAFAQGAFATTTGAVTGALRLASVAAGMFWAALGPITLVLAAIGAAFAIFQDFVPILGGAAGETAKFSKEMNDLADKYDGVAEGQKKVSGAIEKTDKNTRQYTGNVNKFLIPALETITKFTVVGQVAQALDVLTDKLSGGKVKLGLGDKISAMFKGMKDNMQDFMNAPAWEAIERVGAITEERIAETMKKSTDLGKGDFVSKTAKKIVAKANSESRSLSADEMTKVLAAEDKNLQSTKKANDELISSLTERMGTLNDPAMKKAIQNDIDGLTAQTGKLEQNAKKQREYANNLEELKKAIEENDFSKSEKNIQDLLGFIADPEMGEKLAKPFNELNARVKDIPEEMRKMFSDSMNLASNSQRRQATQLIASSNEFFKNVKNASSIKNQKDLNTLRGDADAFLEKINSSLEAGTITDEFAKKLKQQILDQNIDLPQMKGSILSGAQIDGLNADILKGDQDLAAKQEVIESRKVEKLKTLQAQRGKNAKEIQVDMMKLDLEASDRQVALAEKTMLTILEQEHGSMASKRFKDAEQKLFMLREDRLRKQAALEDEIFNQQIEKQQKQLQNATAKTVQGYKQQQNTLELMGKDLQLVQQLEQSRTSLAKITGQYEDSKLASQLKLTTDLEARSILETETAERKAEGIKEDYQAESRNLELQQKQSTIAAEREIIQNRIAQAENKREIAMAQIELDKAKRNKASTEELEAINLQISSLREVGSMVKSQEGQLLKAKDQQVEINANARQEMEIRHQIAKEGGELDLQIAKQKEIIVQLENQAKQEQVRSEALTKAYDRQNKLLNARKSFNDTQASYVDGQLKIAIDAETSEKRKKELEQIAAAKKIETMLKQQEIERQIFEIQQLQNQAALEREKIQARIQKAQAEVEVAQAQAELEKMKADPKASERQIAAAEKQLSASLMKSQAADFSAQQLAMQEQQQQMLAGVERQQMQMNQELSLDQARSQAAQVLGNKELQQQLAQQSLVKAIGTTKAAQVSGMSREDFQQQLAQRSLNLQEQLAQKSFAMIGTTNQSGAAVNLQAAIQRAPAVGLSDPATSPAVLAVQAETAQLEAQRQVKSDLLDLGGQLEDQQQRQTKAVEATGKAAQAQAKDARSLDFVARTGRTDIAQYVGEAKQTAPPGKKPLTAGDVQGDPSKGLAYLEQLGKGRSSIFVNLNGDVAPTEDLNRYVPGADGLTPAERDRQRNAGKRPAGSPPAPVGPYGGKFSGDPFAPPPVVAPPAPTGPRDAASMAFLSKLGDNYTGMQRYVGEARPTTKGPRLTADQVGGDAMKGLRYLQQRGEGKSSIFVNLNGDVRPEEDLARYVPGADGLTTVERERLTAAQRGAPSKIAPKSGGILPSGIEVTAPATPSFANAQTAQATQQAVQSQAQGQDSTEKQLEPIVIQKVEITIDIASTGENDKDASKGVRQGVLDALNEVVDLVKKKRR
jgi:hypothetical protein